jgi:hypothetical protein
VFPSLIIPRLPGVALLLRVAWSEFRVPAKNAKFTVSKSFSLSYDLEPTANASDRRTAAGQQIDNQHNNCDHQQ